MRAEPLSPPPSRCTHSPLHLHAGPQALPRLPRVSSCWDPLWPPHPLSYSPHSTSHLPPCQCLSRQVGPGREGRTGWKRWEKQVTHGGLTEGWLGGVGRARQGSPCLFSEAQPCPSWGICGDKLPEFCFPE